MGSKQAEANGILQDVLQAVYSKSEISRLITESEALKK
jgi:hypothetical protein